MVTHDDHFKGESLEPLARPLCVTIDYDVLFKNALNFSVYLNTTASRTITIVARNIK